MKNDQKTIMLACQHCYTDCAIGYASSVWQCRCGRWANVPNEPADRETELQFWERRLLEHKAAGNWPAVKDSEGEIRRVKRAAGQAWLDVCDVASLEMVAQ